MVRILVISGDGIAAGKTTLANKLGDEVWSLAGALRAELAYDYPDYNWENRSQEYKATTRILECGKKSMREVMVERGQVRCSQDPIYWVRKLADKLEAVLKMATNQKTIAIDDARKVSEIEHLKSRFPNQVLHIHVINSNATHEPEFENGRLCEIADYRIGWKKYE
jgi:hypothetical protein